MSDEKIHAQNNIDWNNEENRIRQFLTAENFAEDNIDYIVKCLCEVCKRDHIL